MCGCQLAVQLSDFHGAGSLPRPPFHMAWLFYYSTTVFGSFSSCNFSRFPRTSCSVSHYATGPTNWSASLWSTTLVVPRTSGTFFLDRLAPWQFDICYCLVAGWHFDKTPSRQPHGNLILLAHFTIIGLRVSARKYGSKLHISHIRHVPQSDGRSVCQGVAPLWTIYLSICHESKSLDSFKGRYACGNGKLNMENNIKYGNN